MTRAPFEQFIKSLLNQTDAATALRNLAERNIPLQDNKLMSAVESILLEESIAAQFDAIGYADNSTKQKVLAKLYKLANAIKDRNSEEYLTVYICVKYVIEGYSLTKEITLVLNDIWKKYGK